MEEKDINSLSHTKWRCQYHLVFAPKYRRMVIYGRIKQDIGEDTTTTVRTERDRDYRNIGMPESYPYAGEYPAKV